MKPFLEQAGFGGTVADLTTNWMGIVTAIYGGLVLGATLYFAIKYPRRR